MKIGKSIEISNITFLLVLLFFFVGGTAGYFGFRYLSSQNDYRRFQDPDFFSQIQQKQIDEILDNVGEIILLPRDENPTVARLSDIETLRQDNPQFYKDALNGDLLIIYSDKAIIYRESKDMIINVAPVFFQPSGETNQDNIEENEDIFFPVPVE